MKPTADCMLCESGTEKDLDNPSMAAETKALIWMAAESK